jgi:hypothetical protein
VTGVYDRRTREDLGHGLAAAFLAGAWDEEGLFERGSEALGARPRWMFNVAREVLAHYHGAPADRRRELGLFIVQALAHRDTPKDEEPPQIQRWFQHEPAMGRARWPVPTIPSPGALAARLGLDPGVLMWLADPRMLERTTDVPALRNYRYASLPRRGGPPRVLEQPKPRLKAIQRHVLREILDLVPAHAAAHGFTRGRSAVTCAREHTGRAVVLRFDIEDFFASVPAGRVYGIFRTAGYPEPVAHLLTAATTNVVPVSVWHALARPAHDGLIDAQHRLGRRLASPHLPQGAPTSPALANLAAHGLDRRLAALARSLGATYSRYADDLVLSGSSLLAARHAGIRETVAQIARDEGFRLNARKSTLVTQAGRQRVCGIVVNAHTNLARSEYDVLRATLHDAARHGPASANRAGVPDFRAHLLGRIAWAEQLGPTRGARLRQAFAQIAWDAA